MKSYKSPEVEIKNLISNETVASLSDWLLSEGNSYKDAGICTYIVES